jgi:hypothetical protein
VAWRQDVVPVCPVSSRRAEGVGLELRWTLFPPRLRSVVADRQLWLPGKIVEARCVRGNDDPGHEPPVPECTCGLYAMRPRALLAAEGYGKFAAYKRLTVTGEVALFDGLIPGARGYRAKKARIMSLVVPHSQWKLVSDLETTYGVPVKLGNPFRDGDQEEDDWT